MTLRHLYERVSGTSSTDAAQLTKRCPTCGARTKSGEQLAFTGEHLRCHVKGLQPTGRADAVPGDRRRHPRHRAAWPLRLWFGELGFAAAHANDVSISGIGVSLTSASAAALLTPGRDVEIEAYDDGQLVFRAAAAVRHRTASAVGLEWQQLLDENLLPGATA